MPQRKPIESVPTDQEIEDLAKFLLVQGGRVGIFKRGLLVTDWHALSAKSRPAYLSLARAILLRVRGVS